MTVPAKVKSSTTSTATARGWISLTMSLLSSRDSGCMPCPLTMSGLKSQPLATEILPGQFSAFWLAECRCGRLSPPRFPEACWTTRKRRQLTAVRGYLSVATAEKTRDRGHISEDECANRSRSAMIGGSGGLTEWPKVTVLKTVVSAMAPGVRIPCPPRFRQQ